MRRTAVVSAACGNLVLCALCFGSWLRMALGYDAAGALVSVQLGSLRYFTILSNLLCGLSAILAAVTEFRSLSGRGEALPHWCASLKLSAATAVGLTFVVVLTFLGPLYGYPQMYSDSSLCLHLINPVLAWLILALLERKPPLGRRDCLPALLPPLLYAVYYFSVILTRGMEGNDFYSFCRWGAGGAVIIVLILSAVIWGLARLLCFLRGMDGKERPGR